MINKKPTAQDEAEMAETIEGDESSDVRTRNDQEKAVSVRSGERAALVAPGTGIDIQGLEDVSPAMLPIPFVKLVQPSSDNIKLASGMDAQKGTFYFTDIQKSESVLKFILLRAKQQIVEFERGGKKVPTPQIALLCVTTETKKLFILPLSKTGFSPFGKMIAKFKEANVSTSWEFEIKATTVQKTNDKGTYYIPDFQLERQMTPSELDELSDMYGQFGASLDREDLQEEMETQ